MRVQVCLKRSTRSDEEGFSQESSAVENMLNWMNLQGQTLESSKWLQAGFIVSGAKAEGSGAESLTGRISGGEINQMLQTDEGKSCG